MIRRELMKRFANKKSAAVSAVFLFSLLFLFGSTPSLRGAAAVRAQAPQSSVGPGLPSAGGLPPAGGAVTAGGADASLDKSAEGRVDRGLYFTAYKVAKGKDGRIETIST